MRCAIKAIGWLILGAGCAPDRENTAAPPGDLNAFDPIAAYPALAAYAGPNAKLVHLDARYVKPDGTMDLEADYMPLVFAEFVTQATAEDVAGQGTLAPGSGFAAGDAIKTRLTVISPRTMQTTVNGRNKSMSRHLGMERDPGDKADGSEKLADPPRCTLALLWKAAIAQGAPSDVVGIISYNADGYSFEANGRDLRLRFDAACNPLPP